MTTATLTREQILAPKARRIVTLDVPELEGSVRIRALTTDEMRRWAARYVDAKGKEIPDRKKTQEEDLIVLTLVDDKDEPLLSHEDTGKVLQWPATAVKRMAQVAALLGGMQLEGVTLTDIPGIYG